MIRENFERLFIRVYKFYQYWWEPDLYETSALVISILIAFSFNFLLFVLFSLINVNIYFLGRWTLIFILIIPIIASIKYFYTRKKHLIKVVHEFNEPMKARDWILVLCLLVMWILGIVAIFL